MVSGRSVIRQKRVKKTDMPARLRGWIRRAWVVFIRTGVFVSGLAVLSLLFIWGYHYVLESPHMMLTDIDVEGVDEDMKMELISGAGLTGKVSLLELNLGELKRIIETHPWIGSARVERRFPHSLHVTVEKEVPVAVVLMDRLFYMNKTGRIFKPVDFDECPDFPVVTGVSTLSAESREQLRQAADVIECLGRQEPPWSVEGLSEVYMGAEDYVSLYFGHLDAEIRMAWSDVEGKIPGLKKLVSHLRENGRLGRVAAIDLNQENGAVVSMING
ncbi:MAG TPA: FtsQ-type POTRA domain-containing protein [Desulfobacteraceae bacterium]|nr:FtsQ-type POTRA domain-containing protein [Desulfobacteraceae bacterium]